MAHWLTGFRLLLIPPVAAGFARPDLIAPAALLALLLLAIASDFADGIVARRSGTASPAGQLFDHTADFLFVTAGLSGAAVAGAVPMSLPLLIVGAFTQYVLDSYFLYREKQLRMSFIGRWNGIGYFVPLVLLACAGLAPLEELTRVLAGAAKLLAYCLTVTTLVSIIDRAIAPWRRKRQLS